MKRIIDAKACWRLFEHIAVMRNNVEHLHQLNPQGVTCVSLSDKTPLVWNEERFQLISLQVQVAVGRMVEDIEL